MKIYTDGAYSSKSGIGGWAWAVDKNGIHGCGWERPSTNNRMELMAALEALRHFYGHPEPLTIVSDSMYLVGCMNDFWHVKWKENGWRNSANKKVVNRDLWMSIIGGVALHDPGVEFLHVRGHSGDEMNTYVDQLAVAARKRYEEPNWMA